MADQARREEFVDLFTANYQRIYGYIYALLLDVHETDDIFQQVSLVLWEKFEQFEQGTNFAAWACRVAQFKVLDLRKSKARSKLVFGDDLLDAFATTVEQTDQDDELRKDALAECIDKQPQNDRKLVLKAYGEGMPAKEIASEMNRSASSVHNSIRRIRRSLLACIERVMAREAGP